MTASQKQIQNSNTEEPKHSVLANLRDELAFFLIDRKKLLTSLICGAVLGWAAYSACANFSTPLQPWAIPFAIGIVILSVIEIRFAVLAACLIWTIQMLQYHPELGWLTAILSLVFIVLTFFGYGKACAVLVTPFLVPPGLAIGVPLGLGLTVGRRSAWFWSGLAFGWTMIHAFLFGQWRLGIPQGRVMKIVIDEAATHPQGFNLTWLKSLVTEINFKRFNFEVTTFIQEGTVWTSLLIQWILWLLVAYMMSCLYVRKREMDKAALEYLAKASTSGVHQVKKEPLYRKLPGTILTGALSFIAGYTILSLIFSRIKYDPVPEVVMDLVAAVLVLLPLYILFEGYPERGKRAKGKRIAQRVGLIKKQSRSTMTAGGTQAKPKAAIGTSQISTQELRREVKGAPKLPRRDLDQPIRSHSSKRTRSTLTAQRDSGWRSGEKIDNQYTVVKEHIGGMGIVYEVVDDFSGKKYAVKSLRDDLLKNKEAIDRFSVEAKTWINLDHHPNIVQALMFRVVEDRPLLFMEFIGGIDLERQQEMHGHFSVAQIIEWAKQIANGLAYAHHKDVGGGRIGVIHRDLKPANLMITSDGVLKITDFGLAKVADSATNLTRQATGLGTLAYMPPEQLEDARSVDNRADIYAFGAVLYELLTGQPPATGESVANLTYSILTQQAEPPSRKNPAVPALLDEIILRCLQKNRDARYSDFAEIIAVLDRIAITPDMQAASGTTRLRRHTPQPTTSPSAAPSSRMRHTQHASSGTTQPGSSGMITTSIESILFIDMVGSTALGSKFGDDLVLQMKEILGNIVNIEAGRQGVLFSKGTGDGFMLTFPEASNGARAAVSIMKRVKERNAGIPKSRAMNLRMGLHFGQVNIDSKGDRQGTSVNFASRIESAKEDQFHQTRLGIQKEEFEHANRIMMSEVVHDELKAQKEFRTRLVGYFDFKGIQGRHRLYELIWS